MAGKTPCSGSETAQRLAVTLQRPSALLSLAVFGAALAMNASVCATPTSTPGSASVHATGASSNNGGHAPTDRAEEAQRAVERMFDDPMSGVVVNRTVTVQGKDFYKVFSTRWLQNPEAAKYTISVHERPSARFGSEIWVQYRQQRMFHTFLPAARSRTRSVSAAAAEIVLRNITRREVESRTVANPDMGPEEL